jgi:site-specific DNA-methyltransferase (adenine-specific)
MFVFAKGKPTTFNPIKDKKIQGMDNPDHARIGTFGKNTSRQKDGTMKDRGQRKVYGEFGMRTNIWRLKTAGQERPGKAIAHPAKMPTAMAHDHILSWSNHGDVVLDPFAGSGTTGVEALNQGRKFVGIELAQEYWDLCKQNCENALPFAGLITGE